jgi:hypothetical protein
MWSRQQPQKNADSQPTEFRIIGPRRSGKTTYLSALAYRPNAKLDANRYRLKTKALEKVLKNGASAPKPIAKGAPTTSERRAARSGSWSDQRIKKANRE